jgi:putative phage-type endonuclease
MATVFNTKVFADTRKMSREEWLESRRNGIGGSDASAILGLNPYSSPLRVYMDKIGKGKDEQTNEAMRQGTDLEAYVADRFCEDTGLKVKRVNKILQHPDYPWMLANIDRAIVGMNAGLECKTTSPYSKFRFADGEINPHYYWQSMHYMAVTGAEEWYVAVLILGKDFQTFKIDRKEDEIRALIDREQDFWENHVMCKEPPLPTGSDADDEAIQALYPQGGNDETDWIEFSGMDDTLNLRALKVRQRDELDAEIKEIDQSLKLALGDFQRGISAGWKINWTNTTSSRVDTKLLKQKYPQVAEEVTKTTAGRRFSVSKIKEEE